MRSPYNLAHNRQTKQLVAPVTLTEKRKVCLNRDTQQCHQSLRPTRREHHGRRKVFSKTLLVSTPVFMCGSAWQTASRLFTGPVGGSFSQSKFQQQFKVESRKSKASQCACTYSSLEAPRRPSWLLRPSAFHAVGMARYSNVWMNATGLPGDEVEAHLNAEPELARWAVAILEQKSALGRGGCSRDSRMA